MRKLFTQSGACMRAIFSLGLSGTLLLAGCIAMAQPKFTGGSYQVAQACDNAVLDLTALLSVSDPSTTTTLTWSVINSPLGTVTSTASGISSGGSVSPSIFTYTAVAGVTTDVVSVVVSDGTNVDTTNIAIAVNAPLTASFSYSGAYNTFWSDADLYVCSGAQDTLHLNANSGAIAVVRKLNMASLLATYDTVTIPVSGSYGFFTGPITDSISYSVLSLTNGICNNFLMDHSSITFRVLAPASITGKYMTGPGSTGEMEGPILLSTDSAAICMGTSRQLTLNINNTTFLGSLYNATSIAPGIKYRINGGVTQNLPMDSWLPEFTEMITVGPVSGNIDYEFTQITTDAGCVYPISERLHITEVTNPSATMSVTGTICSGDSTMITVTGTPNQRFLLFKDDVGDVYQTDGTGLFNMSSGPLSANTTYVLYDGYDIRDATCLTDYYDTLVVHVDHAPTGTAITSSAAVCVGNNITLSANNAGGVWTLMNGHATISGDVVTGISAGVDTLIYVVANSCGADTASQLIAINALPDAGALTGADSVCKNSFTLVLPSVTGGVWSVANSTIATVDGSGHVTGLAAGTTTVSYTVTSGSCGTAYAQHAIVVNALPDAGTIGGADSVCFGLSVTLSNSVSGGTWSSASANVDVNAFTGEVTGMLAGNATVTYTAHTYSCGDASETHSIFVKSLPDAGAISGADSICTGSVTTLFNTVSGVWSSSDNTVAIVNASGLVSAVSSGNATITFTNSVFGCSSAFVTHDVVVNALPDAGTITGLSSICVGGSIPLADTIIGGTWSSSDNAIATISGDILSGVAAGSVAISYTVSNICGSSTTTMSLAVVPSPVPVINTGLGNTLYTGSFASYQWYRNGVMITGATSSICDASIPGVYTVIVTDGNGCTGSAAYNNSVGIHDVNSTVEVHIYPNPASSVLNIDAPVAVNVKVLTLDGKTTIETTATNLVDISNLSAGIYMVMVYNAEGALLKIEKIVKAD